MNSKLTNIILLVFCIILMTMLNRSCESQKNFQSLLESSKDSLHITRNKLGQEITQTQLLTGSIKDLKKLNSTKDSTLKKLQSIVNKRTLTATVVSSSTGNNITSSTVINSVDTVINNDTVYIYPQYQTEFNNEWEDFKITATKDSFDLDYVVYNTFQIKHEYTRDKWYKSKYAVVTVLNENPHTMTKDLKSFSVPPPKQRKWLVFGSGVVGGIILHRYLQN